ncbi:NINE protein [Edaphobacter aggregans]|uniref:NINE protein n=1 Tax=Edaphobacter aggregans TaxID=570835 RepID=UPI00068F033A|nr:NINE protein [Edaphobacter aggregans]
MTSACPYCRSPFEPEDELTTCEACSTPHHTDCYAENAGCTVFGCSNGPVDEPRISISASDLTASALHSAAASPSLPTPPPPPRSGASTSVPPPPLLFRDDTTRYITPPRSLGFAGYNPPPPAVIPAYTPRRSRLTYIMLGVFLGAFGGHNFYAGYVKRAVMQLLLTLLSCFFGGIISWIWAIVEILTVKHDNDGVAFI